MIGVPAAFVRALGQLSDWRVLKVLVKSLAITLAIFAVLGVGAQMALARWQPVDGNAGLMSSLMVGLIWLVSLWFLFRFVALAVLQFFADDVVRAVEVRHYPAAAAAAHDVPFSREARQALRGFARAIAVNAIALPIGLLLLTTGIGTALWFWAVNAWLLGRELQDMVWLRHQPPRASSSIDAAPPLSGLTRFALGGIVAAMLLVPFVNLLAPVLGAAAATHLVHSRKGRA